MRRRFLILHNPQAGWRGARRRLTGVVDRLAAAGCQVEMLQAAGADGQCEAAAAASRDGRFDAIVAAGGDGTIKATSAPLLGSETPLGIIPVGTGNVMANEIGLPRDPVAIADCLMHGGVTCLATARANGELFLLMAGAGFDGRVIGGLDMRLKRSIGKLAYAGPLFRAVVAGPDRLRVRIDGTEREAGMVIATLRRCYGGAFLLAPKASLDGSDLRVVLFRPRNRLAMLGQMIAVASGRVDRRYDIEDVPGRVIEIVADAAVPVQVDGEAAGTTPIRIEAGGPRLRLIVPRPTG